MCVYRPREVKLQLSWNADEDNWRSRGRCGWQAGRRGCGQNVGADDGRRQIAESARQIDVWIGVSVGESEIRLVVAEAEPKEGVAGGAAARRRGGSHQAGLVVVGGGGGSRRAALAVRRTPAVHDERQKLQLETAGRWYL